MEAVQGIFGVIMVHISVKLLRLYTWIHIIAGWILTTLLFAGLSGLVTELSP